MTLVQQPVKMKELALRGNKCSSGKSERMGVARLANPRGRVPRTTIETHRVDRLQRHYVETALFGVFDQNTLNGSTARSQPWDTSLPRRYGIERHSFSVSRWRSIRTLSPVRELCRTGSGLASSREFPRPQRRDCNCDQQFVLESEPKM